MDATDARLLLALIDDPRATAVSLANSLQLSRNTVQARLARLDRSGGLASFERRIEPESIGYPLIAVIATTVRQRHLDDVARQLSAIPEVLEVIGISGPVDLLVRVAAHDGDDLYRIAGQVLATPGVERTETSLVMRPLLDYRLTPLLERLRDS
jgi:DNA-binding Lrp family transcriptional regulator